MKASACFLGNTNTHIFRLIFSKEAFLLFIESICMSFFGFEDSREFTR